MSKAKFYAVEEYHRGQWSPLTVKNGKGERSPKIVGITEEHAAHMNLNTPSTKLRYVEIKEESSIDIEKAKKADLIAHAEGLGIEVSEDETKAEIIEKIKAV
jgi:hypothetical protein